MHLSPSPGRLTCAQAGSLLLFRTGPKFLEDPFPFH
jgi:hypothetical protein